MKCITVEGGTEDVRDAVKDFEDSAQYYQMSRLMDPNMGASPSGAKREITWQSEFDDVGLHFDLASDSDVGRSRLNDFLKPDPIFMRPRFRLDVDCTLAAFQMKRYVWEDRKNNENKDIKQVPLAKNDDFPTLFKYFMNLKPVGSTGQPVIYKRQRGNQHSKIQEHYGHGRR